MKLNTASLKCLKRRANACSNQSKKLTKESTCAQLVMFLSSQKRQLNFHQGNTGRSIITYYILK